MPRRTRAVVPGRASAEGQLPQVCVITGRPADSELGVMFRWVPGWTWILLPFGIMPFLLARLFTGIKIPCVLPVTEQTGATYVNLRRGGTWAIGLGFAALLAAVLLESPTLGVAAGAAIGAGAVAFVWAVYWFIDVEPAGDEESLVLRRVHRNFAKAASGMAG